MVEHPWAAGLAPGQNSFLRLAFPASLLAIADSRGDDSHDHGAEGCDDSVAEGCPMAAAVD